MSPIATPSPSTHHSPVRQYLPLAHDNHQCVNPSAADDVNADELRQALGQAQGQESNWASTSDTKLPKGSNMVDAVQLMKTIDFAAKKHRNQRRKDRAETPYINHPIAVATILSTHGVTHLPTLQAALLHDTVEDTDTTIEELRDVFGEEVAGIVLECTDPPTLSSLARKDLQTKTAPFKSLQAQRVKLGDKLHNLNSIRESPPVGWTAERCQKYFVWAKTVTDSCIHSLPSMASSLDLLYNSSHFVLDGKTYKCHPTFGSDEITEEEEKFLMGSRERQRSWTKDLKRDVRG